MIAEYRLPGYAVGVGSKGCVTFSPTKIVDYETFKANQDAELADLAWLYNMNRGVFMTPGREEEWTLSVTHSDADVDHYVAVFREMAADLVAELRGSPRRSRGEPQQDYFGATAFELASACPEASSARTA